MTHITPTAVQSKMPNTESNAKPIFHVSLITSNRE